MTTTKALLALLVALPTIGCVSSEDSLETQISALSAEVQQDLATTRAATAKYHDIDVALADGYVDTGLPCFDGQGYHYIKNDLLGTFDEAAPHLLVYFPKPNGDLKLVSVEWIQPIDGDTAVPEMFGEHFHGPVKLEQLPFSFYALHAWVWHHNANGMFQGGAPDLVCPR